MPRYTSHISIRRIVTIAVLAIILPSLVLTLVGLKLTLDLKRQLEQSLAEQYAMAARSRAEEIEALVAAAEKRLRQAADRLEPRQIAPALERARRETELVEEVFLLDERRLLDRRVALEQRGAMLYPDEPEAAPPLPETFLWTEPLPPLAAAAPPDGEAAPPDPAAQVASLRRYRERSLSPAARIRATQAIAVLLLRTGKLDEAIAEHRRLLTTENVAVLSPSLAVLARYQIAVALARLGRTQEAIGAYLDLYADLVRERTRLADPDRVAYFKRRVQADLEPLLAGPGVPAPEPRRYAALRDEEKQRSSRAHFLAYVRRVVLPRLELQAPTLRLGEEGFRHLWDEEFADQPYLLAYTAVGGDDGSRRILGLKINLAHVTATLLPGALRVSPFGPGVGFVVTDRKGSVVAGHGGREPTAAAPFPGIFPAWRLGLVEHRPAELRRLAFYNVLLFPAVNLLMIVAIIVGVVIMLRGTARELEFSQLKSDFVSNVSHELKTPLALIRMFAETLEMGRAKTPEKVQEYYRIIMRESERLTHLINNVLDFSRIESGRKTYDLRLDDLADVVRDTLRAYSYELDKQGFTVETDIPDEVPETLLDRNAIALALLNLLSNAVKYSGGEKWIRVALKVKPRVQRIERMGGSAPPDSHDSRFSGDDGSLEVAVADHGIGIDKADLDKVFEKFFRGRDDRVRETRGSGLGLAIVKHSVEAHGGTIAVASEKGKGSTFTITLPIRKTLTDGKTG
ncbi:MAG TPA: ATP-binding protein [Planctomycetota bacterium]|nr:ATP-binding protein [Planctomycetota bacterium]HRT96370.1 ATP-binding protein [Planctomycetota bacterium]